MIIGEMERKTLRQRLEIRVLSCKYYCSPEFTIHICHMSFLGFYCCEQRPWPSQVYDRHIIVAGLQV